MERSNIVLLIIVFLFGFLVANVFGLYIGNNLEVPFNLPGSFGVLNIEKVPYDYIDESQIEVYDEKIVINVAGASIGRYAPTGSMKPILDHNSNGIRVIPENEDDIHVGDIISFELKDSLIIHRVIDKGSDSKGAYFITKGDNNQVSDGKIRFEQIKYKTVGVLW